MALSGIVLRGRFAAPPDLIRGSLGRRRNTERPARAWELPAETLQSGRDAHSRRPERTVNSGLTRLSRKCRFLRKAGRGDPGSLAQSPASGEEASSGTLALAGVEASAPGVSDAGGRYPGITGPLEPIRFPNTSPQSTAIRNPPEARPRPRAGQQSDPQDRQRRDSMPDPNSGGSKLDFWPPSACHGRTALDPERAFPISPVRAENVRKRPSTLWAECARGAERRTVADIVARADCG